MLGLFENLLVYTNNIITQINKVDLIHSDHVPCIVLVNIDECAQYLYILSAGSIPDEKLWFFLNFI